MGHVLIFDSGVGGLSVAQEIRKRCPNLRLSYVADDVFRPYGEKPESALRARLPQLLSELVLMLDPDAVVMACNTASTTALGEMRAALNVPIIGVVPAIKPAAERSSSGKIAVLGTPGTVKRKYVDQLIEDFAKETVVVLQGSLELVTQAEAKLSGQAVDMAKIETELAPIFNHKAGADIDVIVLACTHFPLLKPELEKAAPRPIHWMDSGAAIARRVEEVLETLEDSTNTVPVNTVPVKTDLPLEDIAFLIGPSPSSNSAREQAFKQFGFSKVIGLLPK